MTSKHKDSGIEWIGEIPENWNIIKLKNECQFYNGYAFDSNDFKFDGNCSVVRIGDISQGTINLANCAKVQSDNKALEKYAILKDDIVIALSGATIGKVGYIDFAPEKTYINQRVAIIRGPINRLIYKWLNIGYISSNINLLSNSSAQPNISTQTIANLPICLPASISEQQKIADFLDKKCSHIDSVLDKTKTSIEEYKKLKQAVITQAVTKGIRPNRPMKDSGIEWIGEMPEDWRTVKLKYLSIEIGDGLHSTPNYDTEGNIYFINGNNIGAEALVFKSDTSRINEIEFAKYKQPIMNENTILITLNGATYGKTSYYNNEKILLGKSAGYITLKCKESKQFLRYYLQSTIAKTIMDLSLNGTTIANLSLTTLNNFLIIYPSIVEQQEIVSYLNAKCAEIDKLIKKKEQLISELETYKKSLIYEYVTGKKEVC